MIADSVRRQDKAIRIAQELDARYPTPPIPLDHKDPYTLLIAVLLSAQCTDERVNLVTPALFSLADTPSNMARMETESILKTIKSCGLAPTKAKNIKKLSQILRDEYEGVVPENLQLLESLPGVGHKTASVVMSQAFGHPAFAVDTHIHRLAKRWGLSKGNNVTQVERDLKRVFAKEHWSKRHLQFIYFGREHCPARGHDLTDCPICSWAATKKRIKEESK